MIYDSPLWFMNIDIVAEGLGELDELAGKSVLISGATGLICSAVVDIFIRYNETHETPIGIIAAGRQPQKMIERFGNYYNKDYFYFLRYDASKNNTKIEVKADYIIHGASNASPKAIVSEPVETMLSNFCGLYFLLNYAKNCGSKKLLYISSSEIYGIKSDKKSYKEDDYGYIDFLNPRNSYSVGKCAAETLCASFFSEYGIEPVIVRPGHIYGPTALPNDDRIASTFAYAAARGEKLVMKSEGSQLRSYCHCLDCAAAIIKVLIKGKPAQAYNIAQPDSFVTVKQMAEFIAKAGNVELVANTAVNSEKKKFNPMNNSTLNAKKLTDLGWESRIEIDKGVMDTIEILKASINSSKKESGK